MEMLMELAQNNDSIQRTEQIVARKQVENVASDFGAKSYWKSDTSESLKTISIGKLMENSASEFGDRVAISTYQGQQLTYAQVEERTNILAAAFLSLGLEKGDHIAIWGFNSIEWHLSFIAAVKAGLVAVNVNPLFQPPELKSCLLLSDSKAIVLNENPDDEKLLYDILRKVTPEIEDVDYNSHIKTRELPMLATVITTAQQFRKGTYNWSKLFDMVEEEYRKKLVRIKSTIDIFDVCDIQFTSGTTSAPKAVLLTHYNLVNNGYSVGKRLLLHEKHCKLCALPPFFHAYGLTVGVVASIWFGATTIIPYYKYSPTKAVSCIIEEKCNLMYGTPTMFIDLVLNMTDRAQKDPQIYQKFSCVQRMLTGGATCLPEVIINLKKHFPWIKVMAGYGMTELSPVTFMSLPNEPPNSALTTLGCLMDHMETKIVNSDGDIVPLGTPGELCFKGYMVMKGYYKNPTKTRDVIDNEGWFHTGDRSILLENGYAQIVGRIKETIIRGGENIEPKEVEEVIMKHPEVVDVQVYGVTDDRLGEVVAASIKKTENSKINEDDIRKFCSGIIASYKIPQYIVFCKEYPKTATGKVQKFKLRKALEMELTLTEQTK